MRTPEEIDQAFSIAVNMNPGELDAWLRTPQSLGLGWRRTAARESVGHAAGRLIARILRKPKSKRTEADYRHMRKAVGVVRRHMAQRPFGDISATRWRYALMNWGRDPMKDDPI
jgi:hypothetical protein